MPRDPNRLPVPANKPDAFAAGWRACEAGRTHGDNPHSPASIYARPSPDHDAWTAGFAARASRGFRVDHLPRLPSGAFA